MSEPLLLLALGLALYRAQRIVTTDHWPPTKAFRKWIDERYGGDSGWSLFVHCPWCLGTFITIGGALLAHVYAFDLLTGKIHNRAAMIAMVALGLCSLVGVLADRETD